jgi:hypothetical protein
MNLKQKLRGMRKSMTIWFNGLMLAALPLAEYARDSLPQLSDYLSPTTYKTIGLAVVAVNIVLRFRTSTSLADK